MRLVTTLTDLILCSALGRHTPADRVLGLSEAMISRAF